MDHLGTQLGGGITPVWYVCARGGHSPAEVRRHWTVIELWDSYYDLLMADVIDSVT